MCITNISYSFTDGSLSSTSKYPYKKIKFVNITIGITSNITISIIIAPISELNIFATYIIAIKNITYAVKSITPANVFTAITA